jgi:1-acyl-sn-glycerol-3-phosphate acyltransferase
MVSSTEARLETFERFALEFGRMVNESDLPKKLQHQFIRNVSLNWMRPFMSRRTYVDNVDWLVAPPSDRGVVFACNHRSFFDSYLYLFALYASGASWPRKVYFPVRSDFFYDRPLGVMVNLAMGGGCMYPPIYRDAGKRSLNKDALDRIGNILGQPNSMVGLHPEGTRNQGDPYKLLPAQPGIGQIVLKSKPLVVPVFVNGLSNDFVDSLRTSFRPAAKQENPIIVCFGTPVDYDEFLASKPRAALYKRCADKIGRSISECGQREKELRASIAGGEITSSDPNWLWHAKGDRE